MKQISETVATECGIANVRFIFNSRYRIVVFLQRILSGSLDCGSSINARKIIGNLNIFVNSLCIRCVAKRLMPAVLFSWGMIFLISCSNLKQERSPNTVEQAMDIALADTKALTASEAPMNDSIADSLLSSATEGTVSAEQNEERFDISVNSVPAKTFFVSLVADAGINVVAHPEVSGTISLELKNVSVSEALNVTRDVYGYEYKLESGIYRIYPRKLRTKVFPIDYLDVQRVGVSDTGVLIGTISSNNGQAANPQVANGNAASGNGDMANLLAYAEGSDNKTAGTGVAPGARVQTLNKTNFWHSLHKTVSAIIGGEEDGRVVMTNPQSGLVVVTALPRELSSVREFLKQSELSVKRQVVLETKIIEVQLSEAFEAGINWGAISGSLSATSTASGSGTFTDIIFDQKGESETLFTSIANIVDITKLLKLLETQGNVQVLSSPRISTVNNQKAVIRVGTDEFFVTGVSNSTVASAASIVNTPEIQLESFFSGIALDVTPQIAEDGEVILHIHPIVSDVKDQLKEITVGSSNFSLPLAVRDIRESDSIVRARSGQVVVLGGLMQESKVDTAGKRPFIGDIPGVNLLFRTREKASVKTELVILMRPMIVNEKTWQEELSKHARRVGELSKEYRSR